MRREFMIGAALAAVTIATPALALPAGFKAKADALLAQSYAASGPGASVVISEGGRFVYQSQRGLADVASKRPITAETVFRIGSITKQFSAAVVMQLVSEGKLKLDDPLSRFIPDYPNGEMITVRQLLNHTSGIQSYTGIPGWMTEAHVNKAYTTPQLIAEFKNEPAPTQPGVAYSYNNSGYVLVGAIIEAVTGHSWHDEVDRRIARPLGLGTLRYGGDETSVAGMAKGYTDNDGAVGPARAIHMSVPAAAGALIATAADVARWGHALHHGKVVAVPHYAQMIAPATLRDGKISQYGFGLAADTLRGVPVIGHSGGIFGSRATVFMFPRRTCSSSC